MIKQNRSVYKTLCFIVCRVFIFVFILLSEKKAGLHKYEEIKIRDIQTRL